MRCGQINCNAKATHKVFWPGSRPVLTCGDHALTAERIANGLGLYIHVEEIQGDAGGEGQSDSQDTKN